eukprot:CAMPEP_0206493216 /NCGR_PEP_ID=MMETSP0324_2-20121206/46774_1 /ASSEMBLY_ACC=CAM_ASM_000836 /TAXON_ID=2866 /ORGANISM="Crypthecodinium cohnii, Strain Seligo" /LENGTH=42 /DNA_ID= /DNA_START= /DNA_END= /DNA_ORIENTATION=
MEKSTTPAAVQFVISMSANNWSNVTVFWKNLLKYCAARVALA